jgi:hypothetical protein
MNNQLLLIVIIIIVLFVINNSSKDMPQTSQTSQENKKISEMEVILNLLKNAPKGPGALPILPPPQFQQPQNQVPYV